MTKIEFLADVKSHLRNNKGNWYNKRMDVEGLNVGLKFYGKSIQRLEVNGINYGGLYDIPTQKEFLQYIESAFMPISKF